jgi:hypothetical protein
MPTGWAMVWILVEGIDQSVAAFVVEYDLVQEPKGSPGLVASKPLVLDVATGEAGELTTHADELYRSVQLVLLAL